MNAQLHDDIVGFIYEAADETGGWRRALDAMVHALGLWGAHITAVERSTGRVVCRHHAGAGPLQATHDDDGAFPTVDPAAVCVQRLPVGGWLHTQPDFGSDRVDGPFLQPFTRSSGAVRASVAKVAENPTHTVLFVAVRGIGSPPAECEEIAELERLGAHIARAMRRMPLWEPGGNVVGTAARVLDHFTYPMFLVDAHLRVHSRNSASEESLAPTGYLEERDGVLGCRDSECEPVLARCVHALIGNGQESGPGLGVRRFARIARADGRPIGLYAIALRSRSSEARATEPLVMLVFHDPLVQKPLDPAIVAEMFGLSPAESKVATVLAMGRGPDEIAAAGGISVATVRAQIKSIFAKTGVSRQSELVALLRGMPGVSRPYRPSATDLADTRGEIERAGRPTRRGPRDGSGGAWRSAVDR